jgi:hypothetical protein
LEAGSYTMTIAAVSEDGTLSCQGASLPFMLFPSSSYEIVVALGCQSAAGNTQPGMPTLNCATWQTIQIVPGELPVGASASLSFYAIGPAPQSLSYSIQAPSALVSISPTSGLLGTAGTAVTVTCAGTGTATIAVTFADGPLSDGSACSSDFVTATTVLRCDGSTGDSGAIGDGSMTTDRTNAPDATTADAAPQGNGAADATIADTLP